jgi:hypothetical protein
MPYWSTEFQSIHLENTCFRNPLFPLLLVTVLNPRNICNYVDKVCVVSLNNTISKYE